MLNLFGDLSEEEEDEVDSEHESNPQPSFGCNKIIYCATALSTISGDLYRVDQRGVFNLTKAFQVDDAIWAAENATLKAEMSGKKLMHSWNNLSSTLSFRRFKRGFGILQL
ncbi:uncharacterized protein LOC125468295 isoform X1 [Pyrus x bretschneideri]|uniref:uncharacterized protein LOC125468295 isoform X1 n=1 Tax=Pyrus x bretschneideri TaxID=225117 RepID=UPI00202E67DF|nr:uncharacterized protein LOC125468295 isoform X1 [Pyrus x bretschneideri]